MPEDVAIMFLLAMSIAALATGIAIIYAAFTYDGIWVDYLFAVIMLALGTIGLRMLSYHNLVAIVP